MTSFLVGNVYKVSLSKKRKMWRSIQNIHLLDCPLQDIKSRDAFCYIPELRIAVCTNQLAELVEYIFVENVCSRKIGNKTNILVHTKLILIT